MKHKKTATKKKARSVSLAKPADPPKRFFWGVMKAHGWESLKVNGFPLRAPADGPDYFIPLFNSREQAVAWAGGDERVYEFHTI